MSRRKSDASPSKTMARLYTNLSLAKDSGKNGEHFICFAIDYLVKIDERTRRFIMCDLLIAGMQTSERYGTYFNEMMDEYKKLNPQSEVESVK